MSKSLVNLGDYLGVISHKSPLHAEHVTFKDFILERFKCYPCSIQVDFFKYRELLPATTTMKILKDEYNHNSSNDVVMKMYTKQLDHKYVSVRVSQISEGVMLAFIGGCSSNLNEINDKSKPDYGENYYDGFLRLKVYYLPEYSDLADDVVRKVTAKRLKRIANRCLSMLCWNQSSSFYLQSIEVRKPVIKDFQLNYGEEFAKKHEIIMKALLDKDSNGLVILNGLYGTGKTSYLRYLIHEVTEKKFIYMTAELVAAVGEPNGLFVFMMRNKNSVLIIEDAETIMKSRSCDGCTEQATSVLLNLSDGLLSDCLHLPIIVTFNCDIESVDPAFLRKGRLIQHHEFGKLSVDDAQKLSNQSGFSTIIKEPMSLAEIYNQRKDL